MGRIGREFFGRYTPAVAKGLIGCVLVRVLDGRRLAGAVVETEAYRGSADPASHAYRGMTPRNKVMFGGPGHAYVYFTMGVHHCLNVTTETIGTPGAVLIRAIEPREGIDVMKGNRMADGVNGIANGPGNLTKALSIDRGLNGEDMTRSSRLFFEYGERMQVGVSTRVGVAAGESFKWRFYAADSPFVSRGRPSKPRTHN